MFGQTSLLTSEKTDQSRFPTPSGHVEKGSGERNGNYADGVYTPVWIDFSR